MWEELRGDPKRVTELTRSNLLRVYPGPLRFTSSNFNPAPFWAAGVQMTALNYQTLDVPMRIQRAWFAQNGRCGYVLKPRYLTAGGARAQPPPPAPATALPSPVVAPTPREVVDGEAILRATAPGAVAARLKAWRRSFEFHRSGGGGAGEGERPSLLLPRALSFSERPPPPVTLRVVPLGAASLPLRDGGGQRGGGGGGGATPSSRGVSPSTARAATAAARARSRARCPRPTACARGARATMARRPSRGPSLRPWLPPCTWRCTRRVAAARCSRTTRSPCARCGRATARASFAALTGKGCPSARSSQGSPWRPRTRNGSRRRPHEPH